MPILTGNIHSEAVDWHEVSPSHGLDVEEPAAAICDIKTTTSATMLSVEDIQAFIRAAIDGGACKEYRINSPPTDRPIRVYADGVFDLFHLGHVLHLRQAKLSFPDVYLLAGVHSDRIVITNKGRSIMTHGERLEAVKHCEWVDEVIAEAPWVIDEQFIERYMIDYVAHDEAPYASGDYEDVFAYVKSQGKFIPTRRTPGISTSEILERVIILYLNHDLDSKLAKMDRAELLAEGTPMLDPSQRTLGLESTKTRSLDQSNYFESLTANCIL